LGLCAFALGQIPVNGVVDVRVSPNRLIFVRDDFDAQLFPAGFP
jgi:hypothetical protein